MAARDLQIHACEKGGFMVYGPAEDGRAFVAGRPLEPLAAFSLLDEALGFIRDEMSPAQDPPSSDVSGAGPMHIEPR